MGAGSSPGAVPALRRLVGGLCLRFLDLLEDLAHARAQQLARLRVGVVITPPGTRRFARIEIIDIGHGRIVGSPGAGVNGLG
jgi:hypothetical protein